VVAASGMENSGAVCCKLDTLDVGYARPCKPRGKGPAPVSARFYPLEHAEGAREDGKESEIAKGLEVRRAQGPW